MGLVTIPDTVYLVDLENVGTKSLYEHISDNRDAEYIIFYSDATSSPSSILACIPNDIKVVFIDCKSGGNNAMDFCICATAGRLTASPGKLVIILSNDKGYDPMLHMLHEQGIRIRREATTYQQASEPAGTQEQDTSHNNNSPMVAAIKANVPKKYQAAVLKTLPSALNRKEAHEMLQAVMPQSVATDVYKKIKKLIPKEVA